MQQVAAEPRLRYDRVLEPGDCLLNHNLTTFHARTPIGDGPADAQKRHMLRVWIASPLGWCAVSHTSRISMLSGCLLNIASSGCTLCTERLLHNLVTSRAIVLRWT